MKDWNAVSDNNIPGAEILLEAHRLVTQDRNNTYSHPTDDYTKVCEIFQALTGVKLDVGQALLFMVSVKLARLRTNLEWGKLHHDSLVDAIGYMACMSMHDEHTKGGRHEFRP